MVPWGKISDISIFGDCNLYFKVHVSVVSFFLKIYLYIYMSINSTVFKFGTMVPCCPISDVSTFGDCDIIFNLIFVRHMLSLYGNTGMHSLCESTTRTETSVFLTDTFNLILECGSNEYQ